MPLTDWIKEGEQQVFRLRSPIRQRIGFLRSGWQDLRANAAL